MERHPDVSGGGGELGSARPHVAHPPYVQVAFWLLVVTLAEVLVTYVEPLKEPFLFMPIVVWVLFALALAKGLGIIMFYMHLKFEPHPLFAAFFTWGFILAVSLVIVFLGLFIFAHQRLE
jgi:hypothetical protein